MSNQPQLSERHRRVVAALQQGPPAPESLRRRVAALEMQAMPRRRPLPVARLRPAVVLAGVAAVLAVALVLALAAGGPAGPTTVQAAQLSMLDATGPSPAPDPQQPALLERTFAGVTFPDWAQEFGWSTAGSRSDTLAGRDTLTVFYRRMDRRIGYTVISGDPIDPPDDARTVTVAGLDLHRFRLGSQDVVTFVRNGRTCVLSGDVQDPRTLVKLATYKGNGEVRF